MGHWWCNIPWCKGNVSHLPENKSSKIERFCFANGTDFFTYFLSQKSVYTLPHPALDQSESFAGRDVANRFVKFESLM